MHFSLFLMGLYYHKFDFFSSLAVDRYVGYNHRTIEIGGIGVIEKLIYAFCDSPYIYQENYADTLSRLQDIFYLYKNESMDELTDDELIEYMRKSFDETCQGSLDYLEETCLEKFARNIRRSTRRFMGRYVVENE